MADPWEDTIVIALRDIQWMGQRGANRLAPRLPVFIKFDGPTEQTLGDLAYQQGERFYLFEVKSSHRAISSEWNKIVKQKPRRKLAFETLSALARKAVASPSSDDIWAALWTSLRCHHFVYWSDQLFNADDTLGNILVEPYISGCIRKGATRIDKASAMPALSYCTAMKEQNGELSLAARLPFSAIRDQRGLVTTTDKLDAKNIVPLGEDLPRFKAYLRFLVDSGGIGDGQINAVISSDRGRFTKIVTSIDQLGLELEPRPGSKPVAKMTRKSVPCPPELDAALAALSETKTERPNFPALFGPKPAPRLRRLQP